MRKIVFATSNENKIREIQQLVGDQFIIQSLEDIGCTVDIPETSPTIVENAIQKAKYVIEHFDVNSCFAEDSGLEVEALGGEPGVYSARYAGSSRDADANMDKLLRKLEGHSNRKARFITVVAFIANGNIHTFEGTINGTIISEKRGHGGFGYDPVFVPYGDTRTFAEMDLTEKNKISHRAKAIEKLKHFLANM